MRSELRRNRACFQLHSQVGHGGEVEGQIVDGVLQCFPIAELQSELMSTDKDTQLRDEILASYADQNSSGGITSFRGLPQEVLRQLIDHGFVYMGKWNSCPGVTDLFLPFLMRNPDFNAHGYAVSGERKDCRVTIEGVERTAPLTMEEIVDFENSFRRADEFQLTANHARCWYD
jgi:hypothetical protein